MNTDLNDQSRRIESGVNSPANAVSIVVISFVPAPRRVGSTTVGPPLSRHWRVNRSFTTDHRTVKWPVGKTCLGGRQVFLAGKEVSQGHAFSLQGHSTE